MRHKIKSVRFPIAYDSHFNITKIEDALRGRQIYTCTGCRKDVEAIIPISNKPQPYFRHIATDVKIENSECTYSSESYRHKLAKEALQELKSIRVPRVIKAPPLGVDGDVRLISGSRTITAHRVDVEKSFYLDTHGQLKSGPKSADTDTVGDKQYLIVPDVIFFNNKDQPILFIELVATHKIDPEKQAKILALKIDTVTVNLPIESPEAIRECFTKTERTRWAYNYEREHTDYFKIPSNSSFRISGIDRHEREIPGEDLSCRKTRLGNLIRAIGRCLEEDGFSDAENELRQQIEDIDGELSRRKRTEESIDLEAFESFRGRREKITRKTKQLERVRQFLEERYRIPAELLRERFHDRIGKRRNWIRRQEKRIENLHRRIEERYKRRRVFIQAEEADLKKLVGNAQDSNLADGRTSIQQTEGLERQVRRVEEEIERTERAIEELRGKMETVSGDFEQAKDSLVNEFRSKGRLLERNSGEIERRERSIIRGLSSEENGISGEFESTRTTTLERFERLRAEAFEAVTTRDTERDTQLSRKIKELVLTRAELIDFTSAILDKKRTEDALRYINQEAFALWLKTRRGT